MNQRIVSGFSLTVLLLIMIGWVSYQSILEFRKTASLVSSYHVVANLRESLLTDVVSAESEARGYVIMGKQEYLDLYNKALRDVDRGVAQMRSLKDTATLPETVEKLVRLIEKRMERLRITIEARQLEGLEGVVGVAGIGKSLMDELRHVAAELESAENLELEAAAAKLGRISVQTTWTIGMGSILAVLFHLLSTIALSRAIANRERLEKSLLEVSEREQRRIGQDLHDSLCQQLTGISLMLQSLHRNVGSKLEDEFTQIVSLINGCIEETRLVTRGLHPVPDEPGGLVVGLRELVDWAHSSSSINCELSVAGAVQISDPTVSSNLYRIAQESVRNALKHSGAQNIRIMFECSEAGMHLKIEDDGGGISPSPSSRGLGLGIMKYRATSIGGHLNIYPNRPAGTVVHFRLAQKR